MATRNTVNNTYVTQPDVINTPGGGNTTVQYNKNGSFAGDTGLRFNDSTKELTVQGNINIGGWVKGKITTNVYNFFLQGGNSGQVLSTDSTGNLSWVDQSGGGGSTYSNSNVSSYLATFTGNVAAGNIKTNNLLYSNGVAWNLNGTYANSNVANYLPTYSGNIGVDTLVFSDNSFQATAFVGTATTAEGLSNVGNATVVVDPLGAEKTWTFDTTGNLTLPGNTFAVKYANGTPVSISSGGNSNSLVNVDNTFTLESDGNVVLSGSEGGVNRGLVWDYGVVANGVNSELRQDNNGITIRAWTENSGGANGYSAPVNIVTNQDDNENTWTFDGEGNLTLAGNIQSVNTGFAFSGTITSIQSFEYPTPPIITIAEELFEGPATGQVTISNLNQTTGALQANGTWYYDATEIDQFTLYTDAALTEPVDTSSWTAYIGPGGNAVSAGEYTDFTIQGGNVSINSNDNSWGFNTDGRLTFPGTARIDTADDNFEVQAAENINFEANSVVNIYTDASGTTYQWQFGDDGNLTLPTNSSSINYANGSPYGGGTSTLNFGFNYYVNPSNANLAGSMTPDSNTAANVTYIDFNPVDDNGVDLDTTMTFFTGKYVNVTVNDQANTAVSATYSVSQVTPVLTSYLGYNAVYTRQWGDDPAISKIAIFKDDSTASTLTYPDTNNDTFTVDLSPKAQGPLSDQMALIVLWTQDDSQAPTTAQLQEYFEAFVDDVLSPAGGVIGTVRENFYGNINPLTTIIQSWGTNTPFDAEFFTNNVSSIYTGAAQTGTSGDGTGFTADVIIRGDGTYEINDWFGGIDYQTGDTITIDGASLGGVTATNDLTLTVAGVVGSAGEVLGFTDLVGTNAGIWPDYGVSDGGNDMYDDGNYLQTNSLSKVPYSNGTVQSTGAFGSNEWFVGYAYGQFIFVGDNTGDVNNTFGTYGETGADGDGERETGNLSPAEYYRMTVNSVLAYNSSVNFSNESEWNVTFDIAGARTNGVEFSQTQQRTITTNVGDLTITSADDITIQPYNTLSLNGGDGSPGLNNQGGGVNISAGQGSDATGSIDASQDAGDGGDINIDAGNAGYNDGNVSLGANGGSIYMNAGDTEGNGDGGTIAIRGGDVTAGNGNGGTVSINGGTGLGTGASGNVFFGSNNHVWTMTNAGTTWFPTLTVDLHNGGTQSAQTLQFGNTSIQSVITGPTPSANVNAERLIIQGQRGNGALSEGGDVYIWAGNADTDAGDIKIYAGDADNASTGFGGYVNIDGGDGFDQGGHIEINGGYSSNGTGGYITIQGGGSGNGSAYAGNVTVSSGSHPWVFDNTGNLTLPANTFSMNYANGTPVTFGASALGNVTVDDVTVQGDNTSLNLSAGADFTANLAYLQVRAGDVSTHIHLDTGDNNAYDQYFGNDNKFVKLGLGIAGNVSIGTYQDGGAGQLEWTFDSNGNLVLPKGGTVYETNIPFGGLDGNTIALKPSGGTNDDQQLLVYPTAGQDFNHLHLTSGNLYNTELFLGNDDLYVKLANTGNIVINSNDGVGNTAQWTFDTTGAVVTSGNLTLRIPSGTPSSLSDWNGGGGWNEILYSNLATTGGTGTGLTVDVSTDGSGYIDINAITINTSGTGYTDGDVITINNENNMPGTFTISVVSNTWDFGTDGNLIIPSSSGGMIKTVANGAIGITAINGGTDNPAQMMSWTVGEANPNTIISTYANSATIMSNVNGSINTWTFDNAGNLTLPANTFAINYANGTQVSLSTSSSNISNGTSNVTIATSAGNVVTNVNGSAILTTYSGGIKVGGSGLLLSPGGAASITLNNNGANIPTANITNTLNVTGAAGANVTSNLVVGGTVTSTGKMGYSVGGTVTQTALGQSVTINQLTGKITMASKSWNSGDVEAFLVNCNKVTTDDFILIQPVGSTQSVFFDVIAYPYTPVANTFYVYVRSNEIVTEAVTVQFFIMKAPTA